MKEFKFKPSTKVKIVLADIGGSFYTTVKQIREGTGQNGKFNINVNNLLIGLEYKNRTETILGIGGRYDGVNIQLDIIESAWSLNLYRL